MSGESREGEKYTWGLSVGRNEFGLGRSTAVQEEAEPGELISEVKLVNRLVNEYGQMEGLAGRVNGGVGREVSG